MKKVKSKWMLVALLISIALNMAIAGFVGAQWFRHSGYRALQTSMTFDRRAALSTLAENDRHQINQIWRSRRPDLKENVRNFRRSKRQLSKLLSAPQINVDAVELTYLNMTRYRNEVENILHSALLKTAQALPAEKRQKFFLRGFKPWKNRHHMGNHFKNQKQENDKNNDKR